MELITCPECGGVAEVLWRALLESTDGPVEHAKILCVRRHWFVLPLATRETPSRPAHQWQSQPNGSENGRRIDW